MFVDFYITVMKVFLLVFSSFIFFSSCNKQSDVDVVGLSEKGDFTETAEVYLLNNLNDSRGFCLDMTGYKTNADVDKPLQPTPVILTKGLFLLIRVLMFLKLIAVSLIFLFLMSVWK